jgi:hypothetical protein
MADGEVIIDDAGGVRTGQPQVGPMTIRRREPQGESPEFLQHMDELTSGQTHEIPRAFIMSVKGEFENANGRRLFLNPTSASHVVVFGANERLVIESSTSLSITPSEALVENKAFKYDTRNLSFIINVRVDGKDYSATGSNDKAIVTLSYRR